MSEVSETYTNILTKGLQSSLNSTEIEDGKLRFTIDTGRLFLDVDDGTKKERVRISDVENGLTEEQIFSIIAPMPKIYVSTDTHRAYVGTGLEWIDLASVNLSLAEIADIELPLWFSATDAEQPSYAADLTYNTSKKKLSVTNVSTETVEVGGLKITDTKNENNTHTVEFSFV